MRPERPSDEMIEAWICGSLAEDLAAEVEAYFAAHPEDLPATSPSFIEASGLLHEAHLDFPLPEDDTLTALIQALKARPFHQDTTGLPGEEEWLEFLEPTSDPQLIGQLGQYAIIEVLATTGMAAVFKAHDQDLDRLVAIKTLAPAVATNATARERFLREARAMALLEHDHILPIYDIRPAAMPWFVMRYVAGGSLQEALDAELPVLRTAEFLESVVRQLAGALHAAHQAGVIHRDLKPANILLDEAREHVWLADFGIARSTEDPGLTYGHAIPGTPRYMSPEQASGQVIDYRSDLFSFGSVLYHLATGNPPFDGSNNTAILHKVVHNDPQKISESNPDLPDHLAHLIEGLMQKVPSKRPSDLIHALDHPRTRVQKKKPLLWFPILILIITFIWVKYDDHAKKEKDPPLGIVNQDGQHFTDLATALSSAAPGSTLTLRGDFRLETPVQVSQGPLHLRGVGETPPVIEIDHDHRFGLSVQGDLTVDGVHFIRKSPLKICHTLLAKGSGRVEVRNCRFATPVITDGTFVYGISAMSAREIAVRNCAFHGKRFYSVLLQEEKTLPLPRQISLTIEDSYLQGSTGIFVRLGLKRSKLDLRLRRVVMDGKRFVRLGKDHALGHTLIETRHCLINCSHEHVLIEKAGVSTLSEYLTWKGEGNLFRPGVGLLRSMSPRLMVMTLDRLVEKLPTAVESGSRLTPLTGLDGLLLPAVDTPAVPVFHRHRPR